MNLESKLKEAIGKIVMITFVSENNDFTLYGRLDEVTDRYLKIDAPTPLYVNCQTCIIKYFEVLEGL